MRRPLSLTALAGELPVVSRIADCRYVGQGHEIQVALPTGACLR
jgi:hypothetical protein